MLKIKLTSGKTKEEKQAEIQAKIDAYKLAQKNQLENGGPGPVADYEIMSIVNDHNGQFEIEEVLND